MLDRSTANTGDLVDLDGSSPLTPRCCPSHPDWPTLAQHLLDCFPRIPVTVVVRELRAGQRAVAEVGIDGDEALQLAELITRHQLRVIDGQVRDSSRSDPQRHNRAREVS